MNRDENNQLPKLYSALEVAICLGVSQSTVRGLAQNRKLAHYKLGRSKRFTVKHIRDYLDRIEVEACAGNGVPYTARPGVSLIHSERLQ